MIVGIEQYKPIIITYRASLRLNHFYEVRPLKFQYLSEITIFRTFIVNAFDFARMIFFSTK